VRGTFWVPCTTIPVIGKATDMHTHNIESYSKIGLALAARDESIALSQIAENFPIQLLAHTRFVLLSGDFELIIPERMKVLDLRLQMATGSLRQSILQLLDLVIAFDNDVAGFAASMGIPSPHQWEFRYGCFSHIV